MTPTADDIIVELVTGNKGFLDGQSIKSPESSLRKPQEFCQKNGSFQKAIILRGSNSHVLVETIFTQDIRRAIRCSRRGQDQDQDRRRSSGLSTGQLKHLHK
jgi:hypothetical protein